MKKNLRKMHTRCCMTIEAYTMCYCGCTVDCNPCSNIPSSAYISHRDSWLATMNSNQKTSARKLTNGE
jgi:hypothetical protein